MREMKDSGFEWIGNIPETWNVIQTKRITSDHLQGYYDSDGYSNNGYKLLRITDLKEDGRVSYLNSPYVESKNGIEKFLLKEGDFCFARTGGAGNFGMITSEKEKVVFASYLIRFRFKNQYNPFLKYVFLSPFFALEIDSLIHGSVNRNVHAENIKATHLPIPPIEEQKCIVSILDTKCSKVDTLIENQQSQIEKLKSYKQSLITEVVTKGLDKNVPMKDSGVEWLGTFPAHWNYSPFGFVLKERNEKNNPVISEERLSLSIELGVTLYSEKTTNLDRFKDDFTQYKLTHKGDLVMNSMNMIVGATGVSEYFGCVSPAYYTFYDNTSDHITAKYCEFIFRSKTMLRVLHSMGKGIYSIDRGDDKINTCRLKVPKIDLKSLHIPVPPLDEQREIVAYLNNKLEQVDKLIVVKLNKIEKLQQYKKSLIYEFVTGKKEVK